jgi:hypothetical protein
MGRIVVHDGKFVWLLRAFLAAIDQVAKLLTGLKEGNALGWHVDAGSGFGVATDAGLPLTSTETAESANLDFVTLVEAVHDAVENSLHNGFGVFAGHFDNFGNFFDELSLSHILSLLICTNVPA